MVASYSWFLALRYLLSRWINLIGMVGVAVAVWALIVVISVFSGFIGEIRAGIREATPTLLLAGLADGTSFEAVDALLHADDDVVATAPRLRHYATYHPFGRRARQVQTTRSLSTNPLSFDFVELLGIDAARESDTTGFQGWLANAATSPYAVGDASAPFSVDPGLVQLWMLRAGHALPPGGLLESPPGILISRRRLESRALETGQEVAVVSARFAEVGDGTELRKLRRLFAIAGGFDTRHRVFDESIALIPIWELREMLGHGFHDPLAVDIASDVAIRVRDGADLASVAQRLERACSARFGGKVLTWEQQNSVFLGAVDQERGMMKLILFAVMLVSAFLIYATLNMMVTQKTKDIGILSSMGASPGGILAIFLLTGAVIAVVGCTIGVASGMLSAIYLNDVNDWTRAEFGIELFPTDLYAIDAIPYQLEAGWILQVVAGALVISLLAAYLPARRSARMEPVRALAYE